MRVLFLLALAFAPLGCTTLDGLLGAGDTAARVAAGEDPVKAAVAGGGGQGPASCCVNGAFYACGDGAAAAQCLGEPLQLQQCAQSCPLGDEHCQPECIARHGPDPSGCARDPARDGQCPR